MKELVIYTLPSGYSQNYPQFAIQIVLSNIVTKKESPDPTNLYRSVASYDVYSKDGKAFLEMMIPPQEIMSYTKETIQLQEGMLEERVIGTMMSLAQRLRVSRLAYTKDGEEFGGVLPTTLYRFFAQQILKTFYENNVELPRITDELIEGCISAVGRSDFPLVAIDSPQFAAKRITDFLVKNKGKEFFAVIVEGEEGEEYGGQEQYIKADDSPDK